MTLRSWHSTGLVCLDGGFIDDSPAVFLARLVICGCASVADKEEKERWYLQNTMVEEL